MQRTLRRKTVRRRLVRFSLVSANLALLVGVILFVSMSSHANHSTANSIVSLQHDAAANAVSPVDRMTAYDVAANVAKATNLDEVNAVDNQAQSAQVAVAMSSADTTIAAKPQVVATPLKSWRDIQEYTVADGDTVEGVAQKFNITADSLRWSNGLTGNTLNVGKQLTIPPMDGIVVTAAAGDTPQSLATKFHASVDQIVQANDAETTGLVVGRKVIIPGGQVQAIARVAGAALASSYGSSGFIPRYGANGYDYGWCTWYAAARSGAPGNWGNANTWAYYARLSGWRVSSVPSDGAIFQTPAGWAGHVGIVEHVNGDGTMLISDMNGIAGFGRVGYATVSVTAYPNYITRN